ncbi:MAG: FAD-dependent monooxygenase [Burkholderiaceae bacterium]
MKVLIAGGGIGGLTAALALQQQGFTVEVLEQAAELREVGAGVQLSPNATRTLHHLGLSQDLKAVACVASGKRIRMWNTGQSWTLFDLGAHAIERYGHPYVTVQRGDLQTLLAKAVQKNQPDSIRLAAKCVGLTQNEQQVQVQLESGETLTADVLIGADGVHSKIRAALFGDDAAVFAGCRAWRGVIPAAELPPHLCTPQAFNWVGPGAHVIHYPLRSGELINFVGIVERDEWQVESWTQQGTVQDCLQDFAGWHDDVQTFIRALKQPFKWALMQREPMRHWSQGRVSLLGDAAHPTLPMLASGAAMAIEDGLVLARCLQADASDIPAALQRFEKTRLERTSRVVRGSTDAAKRFHNPELGSAAGAAAYVDREWSEDKVHARYDWLFSYKADEVSLG